MPTRSSKELPVIVDKWRSETLFLKLTSGEFYTGYYQYWEDSVGSWHLSGSDAYQIEPDSIEWWEYAETLAELAVKGVEHEVS